MGNYDATAILPSQKSKTTLLKMNSKMRLIGPQKSQDVQGKIPVKKDYSDQKSTNRMEKKKIKNQQAKTLYENLQQNDNIVNINIGREAH